MSFKINKKILFSATASVSIINIDQHECQAIRSFAYYCFIISID